MSDKENNKMSKMVNKDTNSQIKNAEKQATVKAIKKAIISSLKPLIVVFLIICLLAVTISSALHYLNLYDGTKQEGDWSNVPYVADYSLAGTEIYPNGDIATGMTAEEMWNLLLANDSRIDKYLDSPAELKKLLNAELITQYVDTRPNPDEPIDWDAINNDPTSNQVQGIIKLKRESSSGEKSTMKYTDPETFQSYIDKYNETGSEEDKERAFSYFTLGIQEVPNNIANATSGTDGTAKKIERGATIMIPQGQGLGETYDYLDWQSITSESSFQYKLKERAGVTFDEEGFGRINGRYVVATTTTFGAIGDYIDYYLEDGTVISCIIGETISSTESGVNSWGEKNGKNILKFLVDRETWMTPGYAPGGKAETMHVKPGTNNFHMEWNQAPIKVLNGGNYFDNSDFVSDKISKDKNSKNRKDTKIASLEGVGVEPTSTSSVENNEELCWPTDGTHISSEFGWRGDIGIEGANKNHGGIDIAVGSNTNVYATEGGTVIMAQFNGTAGNEVRIDHGNGYITRYLHLNSFNVKVGERVDKGNLIALSGATTTLEGMEPHLHFEMQYNGKKVDPLTYKYNNEMGNDTNEMGPPHSNSGASSGSGSILDELQIESRYYAKVASWSIKNETILTDDPDFKLGEDYTETQDGDNKKYESSKLLMGSTYLDYQNLVSGYTMPLEYLLGFLFVGQGKEFVNDLADLVYNSEIDIAILDNLTVDTTVITDTYTKKIDLITDAEVDVEYSIAAKKDKKGNIIHDAISGSATEVSGPLEAEVLEPHTITRIVEIRTNTIDAGVSKANTWVMDSSRDYATSVPEPIITKLDGQLEDIYKGETPDKEDDEDYAGLAEEFRQGVEDTYSAHCDSVSAELSSIKTQYFFSYIDINRNINNQVDVTNNVMSPAQILEKTDPNAGEPNFVTIFQDAENSKSASNIHSADKWLIEMFEKNSTTANMVDLTKYLLNKSEGKDYNENGFDFGIFDPDNFMPTGETGNTGGTVFYQTDYPDVIYGWDSHGNPTTLAQAGCGITAMAMIMSDYLGYVVSPADIVDWCGDTYFFRTENNAGTGLQFFHDAVEYYNVPCEITSPKGGMVGVVEELKKGNLVISVQKDGVINGVELNSLFTKGGHFIVLDSVDSDGNIKVRDPNKNNKGFNDRLWTQSQIAQGSANYIVFERIPGNSNSSGNTEKPSNPGNSGGSNNSGSSEKPILPTTPDDSENRVHGGAGGTFPDNSENRVHGGGGGTFPDNSENRVHGGGGGTFPDNSENKVHGGGGGTFPDNSDDKEKPSKPGGSGGSSNSGGSNESGSKVEVVTPNAQRFLEAADQVHMQQLNWHYGTNGLINNDIEKSIVNPAKVTWGATYVSHVLYVSRFLSVEQLNSFNYNSTAAMHKYFYETCGWQQISSYNDLQPGDIVFMNYNNGGTTDDHVQIYAGDDTWYNAGGDYAIKGSAPYKDTSKPRKNFYVAYRPIPMR